MAKVFITGITGFLGSNIAEFLIDNGHEIIATFRKQSSKAKCSNYLDKVQWVLQTDTDDWVGDVILKNPDVIIHAAWIGVTHRDRNDWECQLLNLNFLAKVLEIAKKANSKKVIALGSQAEYGVFSGCITEDFPLNPSEAYGAVKVICSEFTKQYCNAHQINWYWLRLFSFFGEGESENWLIPTLIKTMLSDDQMDLTMGEQKYAYLYVKDLALCINSIVNIDGESGIYNISASTAIRLKDLAEKLRNMINGAFKLNFGKLPYRQNQSMHMQGDSSKFIKFFNKFDVSDFDDSILKTIKYYKNLIEH